MRDRNEAVAMEATEDWTQKEPMVHVASTAMATERLEQLLQSVTLEL